MAKCEFCDKGVVFGIPGVPLSPPLQPSLEAQCEAKRVKAIVNGTPKHVYVHQMPPFARSPALCKFVKAFGWSLSLGTIAPVPT